MPTTRIPIIPTGMGSGNPFAVTATSFGGAQALHDTTGLTSSDFDYLTLFAYNVDTNPHTLFIDWGANDSALVYAIAVPPGMPLYRFAENQCIVGGSSKVIKVYADAANHILIMPGGCHRLTITV